MIMLAEPPGDPRPGPTGAQAPGATAPLVSVICTARNASATIARTIESVRRQTLSKWEMVIVDDGSTDATPEVVRSYARMDPRIRLIPTTGVGRGRALNIAVGHAEADLVANLDADDESHPQRLEVQLAAFERFASPVVLSTDVIFVGDEQRTKVDDSRFSIGSCRFIDTTKMLAARNPVAHSSIMARKRDVVMAGGYAEGLRSQFDYELWVRMVEHGCRIVQLDAPLAVLRSHARQSFQRRRRYAYLRNSIRIQRRAIAACGVNRGYYALILARFAFGMLPLPVRRSLQPGLRALAPRALSAVREPATECPEPDRPASLERALEGTVERADWPG